MNHSKPVFFQLEPLIRTLEPNSPAEIHGTLCGMLCADHNLDSVVWLTRIIDDSLNLPLNQETRESLLALFDATVAQFDDDSLSFSLLLPDDDVLLRRRVESLGLWCQGFLSGLGLGGMDKRQLQTVEVNEFLKDLFDIAHVGFDGLEVSEDDEQAYLELVEYIRVGVLLVNQELRFAARLH